jgi:hypothetical protein
VANTKVLKRRDIRAGMNLATTVYAVFMALGLKVAAEALYPALFARGEPKIGTLSPVLVAVTFGVVLCLAIRFSWVPRNLYEYLRPHIGKSEKHEMVKTFRVLMLCHFPIALLHTLLFFGICEAFADMTESKDASYPPVTHFVEISIVLLLGNALWLYFMTRGDGSRQRRRWANNNLFCAALAAAVLLAFYATVISVVWLLVGALIIFFANSVYDLVIAADKYILLDD